jgi:hypothetical protein
MPYPQEASEQFAPPAPKVIPGMPEPAAPSDREILTQRHNRRRLFGLRAPRPSIALAAAMFDGQCIGNGRYQNNCAHFLSNAFVLAGYTELLTDRDHIRARCSPSECNPPHRRARPVRARNMRDWFKFKAGARTRFFPKNSHEEFERSMRNTGFWAVFELDESVYWGGHVCIIDTDTWKVYGTGMNAYWDWKQHCHQW